MARVLLCFNQISMMVDAVVLHMDQPKVARQMLNDFIQGKLDKEEAIVV